MRATRWIGQVAVLAALLSFPVMSMASGLESFLDHVELRAGADIGSFKADLTLTFGVSDSKVNALFEVMPKASDVYMCLRVGEIARQPVDRVVEEHRRHSGQGWGVIAKNLGIQPGSAEFHELKAGRLPSGESGKGNKGGKGGKGRG